MKRLLLTSALLCICLATHVFGQSSNARVSGTVNDGTGAVLPGVEVKATNNATGVVTTVLSNDSGAYNFASLLPGVYTISASLPAFQTQTFRDVALGNAAQVRLNVTLQVGGLATNVEVSVAAVRACRIQPSVAATSGEKGSGSASGQQQRNGSGWRHGGRERDKGQRFRRQ
jgi:hypothetical protein